MDAWPLSPTRKEIPSHRVTWSARLFSQSAPKEDSSIARCARFATSASLPSALVLESFVWRPLLPTCSAACSEVAKRDRCSLDSTPVKLRPRSPVRPSEPGFVAQYR